MNFFSHVLVMITIEGPRPGINLQPTSPQGEHANHYNRDRQTTATGEHFERGEESMNMNMK